MMTRIPLRRRLFYLYSALRYRWEGLLHRAGLHKGTTPHVVKRRLIRECAATYGAEYFVETGTYLGDMTAAMLPRFDRLYTIELSPLFYEKAVARFGKDGRVVVLHGDSASELGRVVSECDRPTLYWLDAHWSGGSTARADIDTPIVAELDTIFGGSKADPVIIVDDARCFVGADGYPPVDEIRARVARWRPDYQVSVEHDMIRIVPPKPAAGKGSPA